MVRKIMLSLLILIAATSAVQAEEQKAESNFNERKANLAEVRNLRFSYGSGTVRIVLDVTKKIDFVESYAENPSRLILDLKNAWLNPTVQRETELNSLAAKKIRIAQFNQSTVRIVIETMADTRPFNLEGGSTGHRFVIDIGNAEFKENPELNKPEPVTPAKPEPVNPLKPIEVPKDVEVVDSDDLKKQQEKELQKKIEEQRKREEKLERERKEKEKQEKEKQERRDKKDKDKDKDKEKDTDKSGDKDKSDDRDKDKDKDVETPFKDLDTDLEKITALKGKLIVIDPGHGGNDAGAIGPTGVMEKTVTLKVALELKRLLEEEGAEVIMTRETDRTVSEKGAKASDIEELGARCEIANRAGAHIFISIHADSFTRPEARGTTGYYYGKSTSGNGQKLADCIRRNLVEQLGTPSRGTQPCNFYVVKHTDMPATLIELGFISNKDEEKLLDSKEGVQKAAQGIFDGIEDYFG